MFELQEYSSKQDKTAKIQELNATILQYPVVLSHSRGPRKMMPEPMVGGVQESRPFFFNSWPLPFQLETDYDFQQKAFLESLPRGIGSPMNPS